MRRCGRILQSRDGVIDRASCDDILFYLDTEMLHRQILEIKETRSERVASWSVQSRHRPPATGETGNVDTGADRKSMTEATEQWSVRKETPQDQAAT